MIVDTRGNKLIDQSNQSDHEYGFVDGVHSCLKPDIKAQLEKFLVAFEDFRSKRNDRILDTTKYAELPYIKEDSHTWKNRQKDLKYLQDEHTISDKRILEIGSWNGWLANRLVLRGATVCAIDYFIDPFDGLGTISHYPDSSWTAIQMDCEDLTILEPGFDMIVFNWNIMTFSDPWKVLGQARNLLTSGGVIIVLGIIVAHNGAKAEQHFKSQAAQFEKDYGIPFGLRPVKGFFGPKDLAELRKGGFETSAYQGLLTKIKGILKPSSGQVYRAIFKED